MGSFLWLRDSTVVLRELQSTGVVLRELQSTEVHRINCLVACGILVPGTGIEPASPALQGRFLITGPPKEPHPSADSLVAQLVKNPPAIQELPVQFLGQEDPLEKG